MVIAALAALVALLQLPGPATCPNLSWRWVALALEGLEADPPAELTAEAVAGDAAIAQVHEVAPHRPGYSGEVACSAPGHVGSGSVVDAGVTRAPPVA
jgi:hypothetical protein